MILHITSRFQWQEALQDGIYRHESLANEGFIHCSTVQQVLIPANELFQGQPDLVLLGIEPQKVQPAIVYEDCYQSGQAFPHIYGPINLDAVIMVVDFPPGSDGKFSLPVEIMNSTKIGR